MPIHEEPAEKVGEAEFRIVFDEPTPEAQARWDRRAEALANMLLALWEQEQKRRAAKDN